MRALVVVAVAGCWRDPPPAPVQPARAAVAGCPWAMRATSFTYARHELFPGCSPPQLYAAIDFACGASCPQPCAARHGADPDSRVAATFQTRITYAASGQFATEHDDTAGIDERCTYRDGRLAACEVADARRQRFQRDRDGRMTHIRDNSTVIDLRYDAAGRLATIASSVDGDDSTVELAYDTAGRVATEVYRRRDGAHHAIAYRYDARGRLLALTSSAEPGWRLRDAAYEYGAGDRIARTITRHAGRIETADYAYDARGRPTRVAFVTTDDNDGRSSIWIAYDYACR